MTESGSDAQPHTEILQSPEAGAGTGYLYEMNGEALTVFRISLHDGGEAAEAEASEVFVATNNPGGLEELAAGGSPTESVTFVTQAPDGQLLACGVFLPDPDQGVGPRIEVQTSEFEGTLVWRPHDTNRTQPDVSGDAMERLKNELLSARVRQLLRSPETPTDLFEEVADRTPWEQQHLVDAWSERSNERVEGTHDKLTQLIGIQYARAANHLAFIQARPWIRDEGGAVYGINRVANELAQPWQEVKEEVELGSAAKIEHAAEVLAQYDEQIITLIRHGSGELFDTGADVVDEMIQVIRQVPELKEELETKLHELGVTVSDQEAGISMADVRSFLSRYIKSRPTTSALPVDESDNV